MVSYHFMSAIRGVGLVLIMVGMGVWGCGSSTNSSGGTTTSSTGAGSGGATSTSTSGAGGAGACVPGAQAACACLGGKQGIQVCKADGSGFEACQGCDGGTGGAGGAGGATTTTTTTTTSSGAGGMSLPCPGGPTEIDLHQATLYDNPPGLADWPVSTTLTEVDFTSDGVRVSFSKKDGPERWPDIVPPGWDGPLEYTLGMAECIEGQWHASAAIQFWNGLDASGGNVAMDNQVAVNWYYDARWGKLAGRQPATGEIIGIFVVAGNARGVHEDTALQSPVMERSNVVLVPMPDVSGAQHPF